MSTNHLNIAQEDQENKEEPPVTVLTDAQCWELAEKTNFARLGTYSDGEVFITPLNILAHDGKIYFRTAAGSKLTQLQLEEKVTIEFDKAEGASAYSVNIFGTARILTDSAELQEIMSLGLKPWLQTPKLEFVEITPTRFSGRRFKLGKARQKKTR